MLRLVRVLGVLAAIAFLGVRLQPLAELLTHGCDTQGGDLFQQVRVRDFREPMPSLEVGPALYGAPSESADIYLIGDSYVRICRGGPNLAERLRGRFSLLRSCAPTPIHPRFYDPSDLFRLERIQPGRVKVVVWETTERTLADVALKMLPQPFHSWDTTWRFSLFRTMRDVRNKWFTGSEAGYQYLLMNSIPTRGGVELWNTARFRIGGTLPPSIGAWLRPPPHLFLAEEVASEAPLPVEMPTSFRQERDSALSDAVAASLADARDRLRRDFGSELVVLVVPAKASLLHARLGSDYDDFIPRVLRALERRGVRTIDSWNGLVAMGELATLRTETHLSPSAYALLTDSVVTAIREAVESGAVESLAGSGRR